MYAGLPELTWVPSGVTTADAALAPACRGMDFFPGKSLQGLLPLYLSTMTHAPNHTMTR